MQASAIQATQPVNPAVMATVASDVAANASSESHLPPQPTLPLYRLVTGKNPRTYFDPVEMQELRDSIKAQGVLQPILVRPLGDAFEIIAGERRYRACYELYGEDYEIPVLIKVMTDEQAEMAALIENFNRADMSPTEEAAAAAAVVGRLKGDRDEAARMLGWSRSVLDQRLALMNCSELVRAALNERKIKLGHAELLAALTRENQDKLLPVIVKEDKTVAEVKAVIEQASSKLSAAIFDKSQCADCSHNSSIQTSMFAESVTDGSCTNSACYREKTEARLQEITAGLKDEYPVIRIIRVGDNETRTKLEATGAKGVGEEQANACSACANYGAAVSALPQAMGKVFTSQCFDVACNSKKIAARIKAEQEAEAQSKAAAQPQGGARASGSTGAAKPAASAPAKAEAEKKAVSVSESERVKAYRIKLWRNAMAKEISSSADISIQYLIAISVNGSARHISSTGLSKAFNKLTGIDMPMADLGKQAAAVAQASSEQRSAMVTLLAASAMEQIDVSYLQQLARFHTLDLSKHWALDKEFLDLLTKSEIEFVCGEVGLDKAYGEGFKKLFSEKKSDLIDKLVKVAGFDYSAKIPKVLKY